MSRPVDIHTRAEQLVRESHGEMTKSEAYQELSRRGREARQRRRGFSQQGVLHPTQADRQAFWYLDR